MIKLKDLEAMKVLMDISMKENGKMMKKMDLELKLFQKNQLIILDILKIIKSMGMEKYFSKTKIFMRECFLKIIFMEKELLSGKMVIFMMEIG